MWRDLATGLAARLVSYVFFGVGFCGHYKPPVIFYPNCCDGDSNLG